MAEIVAAVGVAAAATQFVDIGGKLIVKSSRLISRLKNVPRLLETTQYEVQELLEIADLFANSSSSALSVQNASSSQTQPSTLSETRSRRQESAWKCCAEQARLLEAIINSLIRDSEDSHAKAVWKRICSVKKEKEIERILERIERQKSSLTLWYVQECSETTKALSALSDGMMNQMLFISRQIGQTRTEPSQTAQEEGDATKTVARRDLLSFPTKCPQQETDKSLTKKYATKLHQPIRLQKASSPRALPQFCNCINQSRSGNIEFSGFTFGFRQRNKSYCPIHSRTPLQIGCVATIEGYVKVGTVLVGFLCSRRSLVPSVSFSLRAEFRTEHLPLLSFFYNLYRSHLYEKAKGGYSTFRTVSLSKQQYLLSVVRKMLEEACSSGRLSPHQKDASGRTLLHRQIRMARFCRNRNFMYQVTQIFLSMGFQLDVENDNFVTPQQLLLEQTVYEQRFVLSGPSKQVYSSIPWTVCSLPKRLGAMEILECVFNWPEAIEDLHDSQIINIVKKRSTSDLREYSCHFRRSTQYSTEYATPLHYAVAVCWSEGVELLLAHGWNQFQRDGSGRLPLDIAIIAECSLIAELLLRRGCDSYIPYEYFDNGVSLPESMLGALTSDNEEVQDVMVEALVRDRDLLPTLRPHNDLSCCYYGTGAGKASMKLYAVGFRELEEYDDEGRTPLINAVMTSGITGSWKLVAALMQNGAKVTKPHRDFGLLPGHFLTPDVSVPGGIEDEKLQELLRAAFNAPHTIESTCRCHSDGYSPVHSIFRTILNPYHAIEHFCSIMGFIEANNSEYRKHWRDFVRLEIFGRLELTHTCLLTSSWELRSFEEDEREQIEDEEEELYQQLEEMLADYDEQLFTSKTDIDDFHKSFLDNLDYFLTPMRQTSRRGRRSNKGNLLNCYETYGIFRKSNGDFVKTGYVEGPGESNVLSLLFD